MKTYMKNLVIGSVLVISFVLAVACQKDAMNVTDERYASVINVMADGTSTVVEANLKSAFISTPALTVGEMASILNMKEEEKLARDVYAALYKKWGSQIFSNISAAENNHLNALILLLQNYGSTENTAGEAGKFSDVKVQALYDRLVTNGTVSIGEAYKTGALIEEMDISDLKVALSTTANANVIMVLENLYRGSRNHLRAFNRQLTTLAITYNPVYISQSEYGLIVNAAIEKGKLYRMNNHGGNSSGCVQNGPFKMGK